MVLKTYHLTGIHHKTCLKHSNFLNRILCVQLLPTWNTMATGNRRKNKTRQNELRQGSKHCNYNMPPRLIGRNPELRPVHQSPDSAAPMGFASFSRGFKSGSARKQHDCCIEPNCYEWNACQHKMRKGNEINRKTLREERETTTWITKHGST